MSALPHRLPAVLIQIALDSQRDHAEELRRAAEMRRNGARLERWYQRGGPQRRLDEVIERQGAITPW